MGFLSLFPIIVLLLLLPFLAICLLGVVAAGKANCRPEAKVKYEESLAQLKLRPTDPNLKQETLALGREYSNLTRDRKGVTVYDEVALANDIGAACAAATAAVQPVSSFSVSAEARLAELMNLEAKGLVTKEEYQEQRQRILSAL